MPPAAALRYCRLAGKGPALWAPVDAPWQSAAENWIVVHDLYHHSPHDSGGFAHEWATLGAEYYVNYENVAEARDGYIPGMRAIERAAASIVAMALHACGPRALTLGAAPPACEVDALANKVFEAAALAACKEMSDSCRGGQDPDYLGALARLSDRELLAAILRQGYCDAKRRFPDQRGARAGFESLLQALHTQDRESGVEPGDVLELHLQGHVASMKVHRREA